MSMGYGELEANNEKQSVSKVQRKSISLKLKRDSHDDTNNMQAAEKTEELKNQAETLNWNFKVKLAGEKKKNKENLLNFCEKCKRPILIHGRLIPCKHFLCLNCAQKGTRNCFKCDTPIKGIQPVPKIYVCAHEGTRHSLNGCRKSYLNFVGLDQHQKLRHSGDEGIAVDPNVDSDGELSVNKQHAAATTPATPAPATPAPAAAPQPPPQPQQQVSAAAPQFNMGATMQPTSMSSLPPGAMLPANHQVAAAAAAAAAALSRPGLFSQLQQPSVAHPVMTNSTRLTFANPATRPTAVLLFPRPQLAVTSMTPLLVPPRGLGAPQMLTLPGMLPQPSGMMPMPPGQFQSVPPQQVPPQQVPSQQVTPQQVPPQQVQVPTQQVQVPPQQVPPQLVPQPAQPEQRTRPQLPTPPSMPMPEQMRENGPGLRDTPPPAREYTPPVRSEVPGQLREGHPQHYSPSHDTPPPPPPRSLRPDQRPSHDPREPNPHDPRRNSDPREQTEFRGFNSRDSSYANHEYDQAPRDPRKARDIPPPPPPRNGAMR